MRHNIGANRPEELLFVRSGMSQKKHIVVLSGAGVSAESGLKTFRDSGGLWEGQRVEDVATPGGWRRNPGLVLEFYNQRRKALRMAEPNPGHLALAQLERGYRVTIVTQNVDDLHERAGSSRVLHLHGELLKARSSIDDSLIYSLEKDEIKLGDLCEKGSQLRPHIIWFEEPVPMMEVAADEARRADIFIVIGTSLMVYPAASLIDFVPDEVPKYVIDPQCPSLWDINNLEYLTEKASTGAPKLAEKLLALASKSL